MTSRRIGFLAAVVALSVGVADAEARAGAGSAPSFEAASGEPEARIETLVRRWFAVLDDPTVAAETLTGLLAETRFELVLDGEVIHDRGALLAWASNLRTTFPQIEHRLDPIRIQAQGRGSYRVRFEVDRRAVDGEGLPHVARREHTWIVRSDAGATPVISRMDERPLLFFPGTGPQIVCY